MPYDPTALVLATVQLAWSLTQRYMEMQKDLETLAAGSGDLSGSPDLIVDIQLLLQPLRISEDAVRGATGLWLPLPVADARLELFSGFVGGDSAWLDSPEWKQGKSRLEAIQKRLPDTEQTIKTLLESVKHRRCATRLLQFLWWAWKAKKLKDSLEKDRKTVKWFATTVRGWNCVLV